MSRYAMSNDVRRFLTEIIRSAAQLELLLLLRTSAPKCWTVAQLVEELRVDREWVSKELDVFCRDGVAIRDEQTPPAFCFHPATPQIESTVSAVAQDYLLNRVAVIEFIYSKPHDTLRVFADAFRIRKDQPRG